MYIIHSLKKKDYLACKDTGIYGQDSINEFGFIHCSDLDNYHLVAPNFKNESEERIIFVINTDKVKNQIKWEENSGYYFPHIYGLLNLESVELILPHLWSKNKEWIPNEELNKYKSIK